MGGAESSTAPTLGQGRRLASIYNEGRHSGERGPHANVLAESGLVGGTRAGQSARSPCLGLAAPAGAGGRRHLPAGRPAALAGGGLADGRPGGGALRPGPPGGGRCSPPSPYRASAYGDGSRATGRLETPPVFEDFSYREYLARQGVYSLMSRAEVTRMAAGQAGPLLRAVFALRQRGLRVVHALFPEPEASLLAGILLGVESGIHPELRQAFNDTGTTHIIAISGFNITLLAGLVVSLFGRWLGPRRGAVAAGIAIAIYALMVGADPAVIRAAIMGGLALTARLLGRQTHAMASLGAAALAMTALNPLILWDVGFQLSFAATLGLVLYADPIAQRFLGLASRWMDPRRAARPGRA